MLPKQYITMRSRGKEMETVSCSVDKVAKTIANRRLDVSIGLPATLESAVLLFLALPLPLVLSRSSWLFFCLPPCQSINNSLRLSDLFSETRRSPRRIARKKIFRLSATAGHKCFSLCTCIMPKQNCAINIIMIRAGEREGLDYTMDNRSMFRSLLLAS